MIRRLSRGLGAVACVAAAAILGMASISLAATTGASGNMSDVQAVGRSLTFVFDGLDNGPVDPNSVVVTVDGQRIKSTAVPINEGNSPQIHRSTMLVVDTSGSMLQNGRIDGARQAARAFIRAAPADLAIGLVTFDNRAKLIAAPSTDYARVIKAVDGLAANPNGSTAIYDGVATAVRQLGGTGTRSIVLLTDGVPEGGNTTAGQAVAALKSSNVRLDAVAFQTSTGRAPLKQLTDAGKGQVVSSGSATELTAQFQAAAERLSSQLLVNADVPADGPSGQVTLTVNATAGGTAVTDSAIALIARDATPSPTQSIDSSPTPVKIASGPLMSNQLIWLAASLLFLGLLGVLAFALNAAAPGGGSNVSKQLSVYTLARGKATKRSREPTAFGESTIAQTAVEFAGRITAKRGFEEWLQLRLEAAANPLKPAEWILLQSVIVLLLPLFAFVVSGRNPVWTIVAAVFALARGFVMLDVRANRRRKKFEDSLADNLQLMAGSLSAGYSLPQAADSVVREGVDPISTEFNRALVETRLGVSIEDALDTVADRMRSKDFSWVVMAIRIQREVGGNLAELLLTVAATLRERARLRRQVQTLSAEGRLSAWILGGLPVVFTLYLLTARPDYILVLGKEPLGWLMIGFGVIAMVVGALWMKKIVDVEV
jgi:tight adherence protein B